MNKHRPYNNVIESKLEQLSVTDADHLWNDMHSILDKKMPQKKDRRRYIFWWFASRGPIVLAFTFFIIGSSILFLSTKENSVAAIKHTSDPLQTDKLNKNDLSKASPKSKENVSPSNSKHGYSNTSATSLLYSTANRIINYGTSPTQEIKQSKEYTGENEIDNSIQTISKTGSDFHVAPVSLESIHQDFSIDTDHNKEIDSLIKNAKLDASNVKPNSKKVNEGGIYAGVMIGVDLSSVHFQSVRTGSTKGFILGYAFNKKWSIETGLLADTKRVYDNGSYFNPPGYTPTNGLTIVAVNGMSRLYEWPVNIKYTVISGKHNLFTTTGVSSYFMKSENYDYEYMQNNQPGGHNYLKYTNRTKDWFPVLNFSLGYTHKLGTTGNLRVEPYLKVPVKNIGVGNMPIMSTGLNIGFTKQIK